MHNVSPRSVLNRIWVRPTTCRPVALAAALAIALEAAGPFSSIGFAQSDNAAPHCVQVGGAFVTNLLGPDQTAGTATGDLKGALGVKILSVAGRVGDGKPIVGKVQHFWVTESGDTLFVQEADVTFYPAGSPNQLLLYSLVYEQGFKILGGTGKFDGATGDLKSWGSVDFSSGQGVGRYSGTICFKAPGKP